MFKNHPDPMRMEQTPERVYAVCKMVERRPVSKEDLIQLMTLGGEHPDVLAAVAVAMDELQIVAQKDELLTIAVPTDILATPVSFRRFVSSNAFRNENSTFFRFTKWLIAENERIFSLGKWEVLSATARKESNLLDGMNENAVLGWRFWAAFLGIGYLSGTIILPNMKTRIQDVLITEFPKQYSFDQAIRAKDFIEWISAYIREVDFYQEQLPLAFSAGLRTLNALGLISLEVQRDTDATKLYSIDGDPNNAFSHITIREVICR